MHLPKRTPRVFTLNFIDKNMGSNVPLHVSLWIYTCMPFFEFSKTVLDRYMTSHDPGIHDPVFLLHNMIMPVNTIVHHMLKTGDAEGHIKIRSGAPVSKLRTFYRAYFASQYMRVILELGLDDDMTNTPLWESRLFRGMMNMSKYKSQPSRTLSCRFPSDYPKQFAFPLQVLLASYPEYLETGPATKWFQGMPKPFITPQTAVVEYDVALLVRNGATFYMTTLVRAYPCSTGLNG